MKLRFSRQALAALGFAALVAAALPAQAATSLQFSFDTSGLAGSEGYLDFSFIGLSDSLPASATIGHLSGGTATGAATLDGDAAATASGWRLGNGGGFNAVWQPWTFAGSLGFTVSLDGDYSASPSGTTFSFRLWNADGTATLLNSDDSGDLARADLVPGSSSVATTLLSTGGASVSPVPEPDLAVLAGFGLALVGWAARRARG